LGRLRNESAEGLDLGLNGLHAILGILHRTQASLEGEDHAGTLTLQGGNLLRCGIGVYCGLARGVGFKSGGKDLSEPARVG